MRGRGEGPELGVVARASGPAEGAWRVARDLPLLPVGQALPLLVGDALVLEREVGELLALLLELLRELLLARRQVEVLRLGLLRLSGQGRGGGGEGRGGRLDACVGGLVGVCWVGR